MIFEVVTIVLVLPLFFGWWTLGSDLSLSPFALALAFDSPILKDVNSAAGAKGVVHKLGSTQLRFGETLPNSNPYMIGEKIPIRTTGRLGFAESQNVIHPRKGMHFSE